MKQQTISDFEYSNRKRKTKREEFLESMDDIITWGEWECVIAPFYPSGKCGRPPKGMEKMLKNAQKQRDPEMHQTKKGNEWRFGMKCHIGVDAFSGLVHTMEVTPANVHDICVTSRLIREDDEVVYTRSLCKAQWENGLWSGRARFLLQSSCRVNSVLLYLSSFLEHPLALHKRVFYTIRNVTRTVIRTVKEAFP